MKMHSEVQYLYVDDQGVLFQILAMFGHEHRIRLHMVTCQLHDKTGLEVSS